MPWDGKPHVAAFIDIGTNSIRLLVVRINSNGSYTVLRQEKEVVRLGESEFKDNVLIPAAMERAVVVCRKFAELAKNFRADHVSAVATSAAREANNQQEFLDRIRSGAGLEVSVISGREEARLIYMGVSSAQHLGKKKGLFIDIGGGQLRGHHRGPEAIPLPGQPEAGCHPHDHHLRPGGAHGTDTRCHV